MLAKNVTREQLSRNRLGMLLYDFAYVLFVAVTKRTLAPLRGRLRGVREWRQYRQLGRARRSDVTLARASSLWEALQRNRAYDFETRIRSPAGPAWFHG
jgi:hypothetical protein